MTTIFDLKNDINELPSINSNIVNYRYREVNCIRDVTNDAFPNGLQHFRWTVPRNEWWVPARSYFKLRGTITRGTGVPMTREMGIAPAMGFMANLYQSGRIKLNQNDISVIENFFAQIDSLETRMSKSKAWLDGIGASINWWDASYQNRLEDIVPDGVKSSEKVIDKITMGFASANTIAYTNDTRTLTWVLGGGATVTDIRDVISVGDIIRLPSGQSGTIATLASATTATIALPALGADIAGSAGPFQIIRKNSTTPARRVTGFEIIFQPNIGLFKIDHALPLGEYEIVLSPHTSSSYQIRAVESLVSRTPGTLVTEFKFAVKSLFFYASTMTSSNISNGRYYIDLDEVVCNVKPASGSTSENTFEVSPSTYALTVAFQDGGAGSSTIYPASKFVVRNGTERNITSLQVSYAGENKPIPRASLEYVAGGVDYLEQRYIDTQMYNGRFFDSSGPESLQDWLDRGPYYFFAWPKDGSDTSTTATIRYNFSGADDANRQMLLFHHKKRVAVVTVANSEVVNVEVYDR